MGLNIALITTWKQRCGIASYSENLANALAKEDVNVYIIRIPRFGSKDPSIFQNIVDSIPLDKIDVIHCQHEYGLYIGSEGSFFPTLKRLGKPVVTTMHAVGQWETDSIIANASDKVIVHNQFCHRRLGYPEKVCVIPHGVTVLKTSPPPKEACKKQFGIQPNVPIVGYVGYISSYKGLETLIEAMTKVTNAGLLIGGGWFTEQDTQYIVGLKDLTNKVLPNRCQWLGFVPDEKLDTAYGAMDILVYPSRFISESGALLMALSHEKAVIARNLAPIREKLQEKALITFKTTADLTSKIKLLLQNDERRHALEKGAKKYSQENSWEIAARKHVKLYESIIADKPN